MGLTGTPQRLGMFGGAFDPPHVAHVSLARAAVEQLQLDELRVFPTGHAWHKTLPSTPAPDRLAMSQIAFADLPRTVVDDSEMRRPGPTYTIDTLRELKAAHPAAELFLVMGEDQAVAITRWREWEEVLSLATLCMAARPAAGSPAPAQPEMPAQARVRLLDLPVMPESATQVRERVAAGLGIAHLVPPGVARYIDQHSLYQPA
ncbi:MAG: nicotinate-nucleotide adenylyltransferase [Ramlibacter sp.]